MERSFQRWAIALFACAIGSSQAVGQTGKISVRSGNEFQMVGSNLTVRLYGVEACAMDQIAHFQNVAWRCGVVSAGWLTQLTLGYEIKCLEEGSAGYASIYGRCYLPNGEDIARLALEQGMALAARENGQPIERSYGVIEQEARLKKAGIWSSNFVHGGVVYRAGSVE